MRKKLSLLMVALVAITAFAGLRRAATEVTIDFTDGSVITAMGYELPESGKAADLTDAVSYQGITITPYHGNTNTRFWNASNQYQLRYYQNGGIGISVPEGNKINQIVISGNSALEKTDADAGTVTHSSDNKTLTWTPAEGAETSSVKFTEASGGKTTNVLSIAVSYEAVSAGGGGEEPQSKAIYLKPGIWSQDDARFAVYLFNSNEDNTWLDFAPVEGATGYYTATIPTSYANMILVRMRAGSTENIWDEKWNQTEDIDISSLVANTLYKITAWGDEKSPYETSTYPEPIATPVISPNGGTFIEYQEVTLSCETEGAKIYYTIDGSEPSDQTSLWNPDRGIRLSQTSTVKAIAYVGENKSAVATATFTQVQGYSTLAGLNELANNTPFAFTGEALVVAKPTAKYVYIHDNSGNSLIYDKNGVGTDAAEVGKYISANWTGKVSIYNKLFELVPDQAIVVTEDPAQPINYPEGTFSEAAVNSVITLKNVDSYTVDGKNITIHVKGDDKNIDEAYGTKGYNQFGLEIAAAEEGKVYDIVGAVGKYNDQLQFWPIEITEQTEPQPEPELSFYVVGTMTEPAWSIVEANKMTMNEELEKKGIKEFSLDMTLEADAEFKVVSSYDGENVTTWFPEGENNNYVITEAGDYTIYCRPNYDGNEDWHNSVLYAAKKTSQPVMNTYTATFDNAGNWAEVYAYAWSGTEGQEGFKKFLGDWPGTKLEAVEGVYTVTIEAEAAPANIIFTAGADGPQTENLAFEDGKAYTYEAPAQTATFNFAAADFRAKIGESMADTKGWIYNETFTVDGATLQITAGSAASRIYVDNNRGQNLVTYKEYTTLTFKAPEGKAITKIEFTAAGNSNINNFTASSGAIEGMIWSGNADGVRFLQGGTSYLANAIVTLADKDAETAALPAIEYTECANIAAFNALKAGTYAKLTLTDAEVIGKSADGCTVWVQDATGGAWIQYTSLNDKLQEKTKVNGTIYTIKRATSGNPQLKEAEDTPKSELNAEAISAYTMVKGTIEEVNVAANLNKVVKITGATLTMTSATAGTLTLGETTINVNNGAENANQQLHKIADWEKDKVLENVTITAILVATSATDATKNQLLPISIEQKPVINSMAIVGDFIGGTATVEEPEPWWNPANGWAMTQDAENSAIWTLTKEFTAEAKKYEYKATANGNWDDYVLPAGDNQNWIFAENSDYPAGNYTLVFTADTENHTLTLVVQKAEEPQPEWVDLIVNGDMEGESNECFYVTEQGIGGPFLANFTEGIGKDGSKAVKVESYNDPAQDWDSQFFIRLPYQIPAGTQYRVSFDYKADKAGDFDSQAHTEPGGYIHWAAIGSGSFTTEWQTYTAEGTVSSDMSKEGQLFQTIAFNLAKNKVRTNFIFDNVKFEVYADIKTLTKNPATNPQPYTKPVYESMAIVGEFLGLAAGGDGSDPNWDLANGWQMTQDAENEAVWTLVVDEFTAEAKKYEYKATANGKWGDYELPAEGNADYNFDTPNLGAGKYKLTFTVDTRKHSVNLDVEKLDVTTYTATFTTNAKWEEVYAYAWSGTEGQEGFKKFLGDWPGTKIEANADGIYTVSIESKDAPEKIIFSNGQNGEGNQTADLDFVNGSVYEFKAATGEEDPIKVAPQGWVSLVTNGNLAGDEVDSYVMKEYPSTDMVPAAIEEGAGTNGSRGILVKAGDDTAHEGAQDWDSQFWIVLNEELPSGSKLHVEFDYKASEDATANTQAHANPGAYQHWAAIGDVNFTTKWQHFSADVEINDAMAKGDNGNGNGTGMKSIAFNLAVNRNAVDYYFDNFGVWYEKPVEITSMAIVGDFLGLATEENPDANWDPAKGWQMEQDAENPAIWTLTKDFTAEAKTYNYKATANGKWGDYELPAEGNQNFVFGTDEYPAGDYKLVFTADTENNRLDLVVKPATVQTFTATFSTNAYWWDDVYAYAWSGEGENVNEYLGAWPGTKMKVAIDGVYTVTVEGEVAPEKIIFNNGNGGKGNQTDDLAFEDGKIYTYIFNPTFDFENNNGEWAIDATTFTMDDITLEGSSAKYVTGQLRVNKNGSITLTAPAGKTITKIEFKELGADEFAFTPSTGEVALAKKLTQGSDESSTTIYSIYTWTGKESVVTFDLTGARQRNLGFINVTLEDAPDTYTAEFTTNAGWEKVYAYAWYEAPEGEVGTAIITPAWPGLEITDTKNDEGVYTATFQSYLKPSFIIFNNGLEGEEKQQTDNLAFENGGAYSYMIEVPVTHTWDFTQWSEATVRNLKADAAASKLEGWSDVEKKADAEADADPTEASKDNCFWATVTPDENGELAANGVTIAELKGLSFNPTYATARSLAIAVNYPVALSTYAGPAYLWLGGGGKNVDCFVINNVKTGTTIKMGVESHKTSEGRGVQLFVDNAGARGDKLLGTDGNEVAVPKTYEDQEWVVAGEEGEVVNVIVYNTKGCHIYYIDAEIGEAPVVIPDPEYYLVFSADDWAVKEDNKLALNTEAANGAEEYMITRDIAADAQFKVVKVQGETQTWYPDGTGNAYGENGELTEAGNYTIYFRPNADGGEDWFNGVIYANLNYTDGIASIKAAMENGAAIYTLQGVRVNNVKKGGMYIVNGRKVAVK